MPSGRRSAEQKHDENNGKLGIAVGRVRVKVKANRAWKLTPKVPTMVRNELHRQLHRPRASMTTTRPAVSICIEDFKIGDSCVRLQCNHLFHEASWHA